jgi:ATP adenylyltransferase
MPFIDVIVAAPVVQILAIIIGFWMLMLEVPAPFVKGTALHRSLLLRVVGLLFQTFVTILFYQVRPASLPHAKM